MTPGTYLRKRREAAGIDLVSVAFRLATLPEASPRVTRSDVDKLAYHLAEAEQDRDNVTVIQANLLRRIFHFDLDVYERLLMRHHAGAFCGLGEPQVCRECACSWHDACVTHAGPCAWTDHDSELCTACESKAATTPDDRMPPLRFAHGPEASVEARP